MSERDSGADPIVRSINAATARVVAEGNRAELQSIRTFVKRGGFWLTLEAAEVAISRFPGYGSRTFKYFCGVCWSKIKEAERGPKDWDL
jgi:hypothetical protein